MPKSYSLFTVQTNMQLTYSAFVNISCAKFSSFDLKTAVKMLSPYVERERDIGTERKYSNVDEGFMQMKSLIIMRNKEKDDTGQYMT